MPFKPRKNGACGELMITIILFLYYFSYLHADIGPCNVLATYTDR